MALRGLPFGTVVTAHSVEVWQVVERKKEVQLVGTDRQEEKLTKSGKRKLKCVR
jgi:hypothetical protein